MNWPVTDEMIKAAVDAWPHLDDNTDSALWGAVYRTMRDADPFASAERAVIEAAFQWMDGAMTGELRSALHNLLRLRARIEP